jgi:PadR family transcriptional regulator PadR
MERERWPKPIDCLPRTFSDHASDFPRMRASKLGRNALAVDHLWEYKACDMAKRGAPPLQADLLQGTLDLLILQTLVLGAAHGHTIAHVIEHRSDAVLQVEHGSLYPALHRLEDRSWIASFWGTSENNRKARYYRLTAAGRRQLAQQTSRWEQLVGAINRVLRPAKE